MTQPMIFISYSHKDEREKDRLLDHLGILQRRGIELWSDDRIGAGADWEQEISKALAQAKVAILLISANFLNSDINLGKEVPALLQRRKSEGLTVFPVIAKSCLWEEVEWLTGMNVRPKNGRPIWGAGSRRIDEDLKDIAKEIAAIIKNSTPVIPTTIDIHEKSESDHTQKTDTTGDHAEKKEQQPTLQSESRLFLKTAGGGQSDHTLKTYQTGLDYFKSYLEAQYGWTEERPIAELHPDFFDELPTWLLKQRYRRSQRSAPTPLAESTRSLYLLAITRFLRFLVLRNRLPQFGYVEYDRIKEELGKATNVKEKPVAQKIPGQELVAALLEAARRSPETDEEMPPAYRRRLRLIWRRNLAMVLALSSSGMRVGELVKLKREDLDYSRQGAWVVGKGRKTRFVAFNQEAWQAIETYLQERADEALMVQLNQHPLFCRHDRSAPTDSRLPLTVRTVQLVIEQLSEQADVARRFNLSPHSLRHYFANGLLQFTGNLALVQEALGHQDPKTTRGYTKIKAEEIAAQVQAMARRGAEGEEAAEA